MRKYSIIRNAVESLKLDISFLYDEEDEVKLDKFNSMTSTDVLNEICCKFSDFKNLWKSAFGDNYSFHAGDDIKNRISEYKIRQIHTVILFKAVISPQYIVE